MPVTWNHLDTIGLQALSVNDRAIGPLALPLAVNAGDLIIVTVTGYQSTFGTLSITDTVSSTYNFISGIYKGTTFPGNTFYALAGGAATAGNFKVTATVTNANYAGWLSMVVDRFSVTGISPVYYGIDSRQSVIQSPSTSIALPQLLVYGTDLTYIAASMPNQVGTATLTPSSGFTTGSLVQPVGGSGTYSAYILGQTSAITPSVSSGAVASLTSLVGATFNAATSPLASLAGVSSGAIGVSVQFTVSLSTAAGVGGLTVNLSSSNGSDVFQSGRGWPVTSSVVIPQGSISGTFWFVPYGSTGARNLTVTATGWIIGGSPFTFTASAALTANASIAATAPSPYSMSSGCYVATSGQQIMIMFTTGLSGTGTYELPALANAAPIVLHNGTPVGGGTGQCTNPWVSGYHRCIGYDLPAGVTVSKGATGYQITTVNAWATMSNGDVANAVTGQSIANYAGMSCFGTGSLAKTFKPGLNHSDIGTNSGTLYNVAMNWRYRFTSPQFTALNTTYTFLDCNTGNGVDNAQMLGAVGYWAVGFDDPNYGTGSAAQVATSGAILTGIVSKNSAVCTVTQIYANNNPGNLGQNQYYLFRVDYASSSTSINTPMAFQFHNGQNNPVVSQLSNLWVVGPGDFTVPGAGNTSWSFPRTNQYALSSMYTGLLPHGLGSARWIDATIGFASYTGITLPWEQTPLNSLSWNPSYWAPSSTVTYTGARPLVPPGVSGSTSYIYSAWLSSLGSAFSDSAHVASWPCSSGLSAAITTTTQTTITVNSASTDPIFCGVLIQIDSEQMMTQSLSGTSTLTVWRGACGTTAATHLSGAPITILSKRWAWSSLSQLVGSAPRFVEFTTLNPHGLMDNLIAQLGNGWPTLTFTDSTTLNVNGATINNTVAYGSWVTGPNSFFGSWTRASGTSCTLSSAVTGLNINVNYSPSQACGFPFEFVAQVTGGFSGCHLHINVPLMATDAYVWVLAAKIRDNFPSGRRVYVELSDEPWNTWQNGAFFTDIVLSYQAYVPNRDYYLVIRTGQIRAIFRTVFGARASEVYAYINMQLGNPGVWINNPTQSNYAGSLGFAVACGVTIDACGQAPYIGASDDAITDAAWANSATIPQMCDLLIHDIMYNVNTSGYPGGLAAMKTYLAAYTANTGNPCVFHCYEGGLTFVAGSLNLSPWLAIDVLRDPTIEIIEQDTYNLFQQYMSTINLYSFNIYYHANSSWGLYQGISMPYGKGDGVTPASNGVVYNNRNYCIYPGHVINYSSANYSTEFDLNTCSVRGLAFNEWMNAATGSGAVVYSLNAATGVG